jgi:hypothetical protein
MPKRWQKQTLIVLKKISPELYSSLHDWGSYSGTTDTETGSKVSTEIDYCLSHQRYRRHPCPRQTDPCRGRPRHRRSAEPVAVRIVYGIVCAFAVRVWRMLAGPSQLTRSELC